MSYEPNRTAPLDLYVAYTTYGDKRHLIDGPDATVALCGVRARVYASPRQPVPANDHWLDRRHACHHCLAKRDDLMKRNLDA